MAGRARADRGQPAANGVMYNHNDWWVKFNHGVAPWPGSRPNNDPLRRGSSVGRQCRAASLRVKGWLMGS
eukprot:7157768-Alexandrium_andersonii.AAC.1